MISYISDMTVIKPSEHNRFQDLQVWPSQYSTASHWGTLPPCIGIPLYLQIKNLQNQHCQPHLPHQILKLLFHLSDK